MPRLSTLSAFAKVSTGGNLAGVVRDFEGALTESDMQSIAEKAGYSETVFISHEGKEDFSFRYFTPQKEVPLCGHATIAGCVELLRHGDVEEGKNYSIETQAGMQKIFIGAGAKITMTQNTPLFGEEFPREEILSCVDIEEDDFLKQPTGQKVSTGVPTLIVGIRSVGTLTSMEPNEAAITQLLKKYDAEILYIYSKETCLPQSTVQARMFAPVLGIKEEPATGMAAGALACYLWKTGALEGITRCVIEQGYAMGRPSELLVELTETEGNITSVALTGTAQFIEEQHYS